LGEIGAPPSNTRAVWALSCISLSPNSAGTTRLRQQEGTLIHEGDTVRFHVADIFLPAADDLPKSLTSAVQLEGTVVTFSDSGLLPSVFAVVDVIARQSVVVPVDKLQLQNLGGASNAL
jgi:hypothetical protein